MMAAASLTVLRRLGAGFSAAAWAVVLALSPVTVASPAQADVSLGQLDSIMNFGDLIQDYEDDYEVDYATCASYGDLCIGFGGSLLVTALAEEAVKGSLKKTARYLEVRLRNSADEMVETILSAIDNFETNSTYWWATMYTYGMLPAHQKMARQMHTGMIGQVTSWMQSLDAQRMLGGGAIGYGGGPGTGGLLEEQMNTLDDKRMAQASENACQTTTVGGAQGSAAAFSRGFRQAFENRTAAGILGSGGGPAAQGGKATQAASIANDYRTLFCDPAGNAGGNAKICSAADPDLFNADIQPVATVLNRLTIPATESADPVKAAGFKIAAERVIDMTMGAVAENQISPAQLQQSEGKRMWIERRALAARQNALRAVPQLIVSWRMPGVDGNMGRWVRELRRGRKDAPPLIRDADLPENPSYREIMHALVVDRANSGVYAASMLGYNRAVEVESLTLNVFYLMQLRDYYELMERTALALAVQVAMLADAALENEITPAAVQRGGTP